MSEGEFRFLSFRTAWATLQFPISWEFLLIRGGALFPFFAVKVVAGNTNNVVLLFNLDKLLARLPEEEN